MGFRRSRNLGENSFGRTRSDDYGGGGGGGGGDADDDNDDIDGDDIFYDDGDADNDYAVVNDDNDDDDDSFIHWFKSLRTNFAIILSDLCIQIFDCCRQFFNYFNLLLRCMTRTPNSDHRI